MNLCLLGAPLLLLDNPEGKSSSRSSVMKDRTRGRRTSLGHSGLSQHPFPRTISTHWVMANAIKDASKPCYQAPNPGEDLPSCLDWTGCWIPTAWKRGPRSSQAHIPTQASSPVSWPVFKRKPDCLASSVLGHTNWSQSHFSSLFLTGMVLNLTVFLTNSPARVE